MQIIACLSQKGGVGKSTLTRLIARCYAGAGWRTKIADFNVKQKTSVDWSALRMSQNIEPPIAAEAFTEANRAVKQTEDQFDMLVFDGKPDSDTQTIRLAQLADLVIIPTGVSADDLGPQVRFAQELLMRGVERKKILFALNKTTDSVAAIMDAQDFIKNAGFDCCHHDLPMKTGFLNAQNTGRCLSETNHPSLNLRAEALAQEIVNRLNQLTGTA